jgi:hypothetical protein
VEDSTPDPPAALPPAPATTPTCAHSQVDAPPSAPNTALVASSSSNRVSPRRDSCVSAPAQVPPPASAAIDSAPPVSAPTATTPGVSTSGPMPSSTLAETALRTRLQSSIWKPMVYKDGAIRYGLFDISTEPSNVANALADPNWKSAMESEYLTLVCNNTWHSVPPVSGRNLIDCKWVYKIKHKANGSIDHYKARLVTKGFKQRYSMDYDDTFSLVVKFATIRLVLSFDVSQGWCLHQLDVQNTFLHSVLVEDVYMRQPPEFEDSSKPHYHCKLDKAIYDLKQAPCAWYSRLSLKLQALGFLPSKADISLFIYKKGSVTIYLLVYVDDIIITISSPAAVNALLSDLKKDFALKDLGDLHYFLVIEVKKVSDCIMLSQHKYASDLLCMTGMFHCKLVSTPMSSSEKLSMHTGDPLGPEDITKYRSIIGALQYLSHTHPDLAFSINKVCQYLHSSMNIHWTAVKCILHYIQATLNTGLLIHKSASTILSAFSNVDWAGCSDDCNQLGALLFILDQTFSHGVRRNNQWSLVLALRPSISLWPMPQLKSRGSRLFFGSYIFHLLKVLVFGVITWVPKYLSSNPIFHRRIKHIKVDYHFVCDEAPSGCTVHLH